MKIKRVKVKQLLKLNLLKLKIYDSFAKFDNNFDADLNRIVVSIKRILQIIFQYHKAGKRILFLGFPIKLELKINKLTKHIAVPKHYVVQGMISNQNFPKSSKNAEIFLLPKLSKKLDLIVSLNHNKNETIISEAKTAKIPTISFSKNPTNLNSSYNVEGDFKNILNGPNKNVFSIGLNFLFTNLKI